MTQSDGFDRIGFAARRRPSGLMAPVVWLAGVIASVAALVAGAVLAVFTAVAVALFAVCAGVVVFLAGLALRARGAGRPQRRRTDEGVIEAHKVDGAWVAYGWDRQGR